MYKKTGQSSHSTADQPFDQEKQAVTTSPSTSSSIKQRMMQGVRVGALLGLLYASGEAFGWGPPFRPHGGPDRHLTIEEQVEKILRENPLIDGHDDLPWLIRSEYQNHIYQDNFTTGFVHGGLEGHVDLPGLEKGQVGGTFWSVYVQCPENWANFADENYYLRVRQTTEQVDVWLRLQEAYPEIFSEPPNGTTALQQFYDGKIISPMGIEGLHSIGNSLANLRNFHARGVAYAGLTHNCHNIYADSAVSELPDGSLKKADPYWHGVSEAGRKLVYEMNRIGMIVDLAHVSADTMRDILGGGKDGWSGSRAPIMFSHSSAYSICPHPRNVPDDVLKLVKERNSVVMVTFAPGFISCTPSNNANGLPDFDEEHSTLERVVEHVLYVADLIGFDHIGLGSDFDGLDEMPRGLENSSKWPDLVAEFLRRGISEENIIKVIGGNILRVWKDVDRVAHEMKAEGALPVEDEPSS